VLGGVPTAFRPLRHRDFRLLWTGLAISLVGSGLWLVALAWQVIELGGGPTELSLVTALFSVGLLAFVLIGGVAADRMPQRLVMLASDLIRAAVLLVLGLLSLSGDLRIWHLAVGGLLIGAGEAFFILSYSAAMVIWGTLLQRRVLEGLRGRVSSLDFFVSLALMPVSMAIAGRCRFRDHRCLRRRWDRARLSRPRGHRAPQAGPRRASPPAGSPVHRRTRPGEKPFRVHAQRNERW
jgi:MFS family permease